MNNIPFPSSYKKALLSKTKNTTIRIGKEIGKYKKGKTYNATTYQGKDWGIKIKIIQVKKLKVKDLPGFGIPMSTIKSLKKNNLSDNSKVELIKFDIK